jgi:hypothetical protein
MSNSNGIFKELLWFIRCIDKVWRIIIKKCINIKIQKIVIISTKIIKKMELFTSIIETIEIKLNYIIKSSHVILSWFWLITLKYIISYKLSWITYIN